MTTPTFPSYAKLISKGFGHDRPSALQRTQAENGFVKQAKVKSRVLVARNVVYAIDTLSDYNSFMAWYRDDINYGATWFDWTDPVDSTTKSSRIVDGTLKDTPLNGALIRWEISMRIETWSA